MTSAEVSAPIKIAICCSRGVAPTRYPVFRSCDVVPPFEAAMHTTAATVSAVSVAALPVWPISTKPRQVNNSVATVMPEIGFDDEPISPVSRDETVTNRKQNSTMNNAPASPSTLNPSQGRRCGQLYDEAQAAEQHQAQRQIALGARHPAILP